MSRQENRDLLIKLLYRFNTVGNARKRARQNTFERVYGDLNGLEQTFLNIRKVSEKLLTYQNPELTIAVPVYNEESEIIPTIISFLYVINETGIRTEIIASDNNSTDRSANLLEAMGIKVVFAKEPGLRYARHSGLESSNSSSKFIWFIDADTRAFAPLRHSEISPPIRTALSVSYEYLVSNPRCIAVSTGVIYEYQSMVRRFVGVMRQLFKHGNKFSCWSGANQFFRKQQLIEAGGIDLEVDGGEDHNRLYTVVRYAKKFGYSVHGADRIPELYAPVFTSDRRSSNVLGIVRNIVQQLRKPPLVIGEDGLPQHPKGVRYKDLHKRERGRAKR